jgi:hypothetical protein
VADDYTTLALVRAALQIPDDDTSQDALIATKITAASRQIEKHCGNRRFWLDATAAARVLNPDGRVLRDCDGEHLLVDDIGDLTGFTVEHGRDPDWTDITSQVETEPTDALNRDPAEPVTSLLWERGVWRRRTLGRVRVTARWGWPAVPAEVGEAALIQAQRLYKRKDSPEGVLGAADWGGPIRMSRVDPDVRELLAGFALAGFA